MVSVIDIIIPIVVGLLILGVSFYLFTMYCHRTSEEKGFGNEVFPKILVILSQTLAWGQLLLLPLDISVTSQGGDFSIVYFIIYPIIFFLVAFMNPFSMFLYQSDESDSQLSRILWSLLFAAAVLAMWSAPTFISYIWLSKYSCGVNTCQAPVPMYMLECMALIGFFLLAINAGIGLIYLPRDLIGGFINRPKQLTSEEALEKKQLLQSKSAELIGVGEKLKQSEPEINKKEGNWFARKRRQAAFNTQVQQYKKSINELDSEYQLFDLELKVRTVHPVIHWVMLFAGILSSILSLAWFIQFLCTVIFVNKAPLFLFIDAWLSNLAKSSVSFIGTMIYGIMVLYLQMALVKGSTIFGVRIPFIVKFHPMIINKTYMNSLLFNVSMMLLSSTATSLLAIWAFPTYLQPSYLYQEMHDAFYNQPMFGDIFTKRIPQAVIQVIFMISFLVIIIKMIVERYQEKKKGEAKANKKK